MEATIKKEDKKTYSTTCLERPLKEDPPPRKKFKTNNRLMPVKSIAECHGAFCSTFDFPSATTWLLDICFL